MEDSMNARMTRQNKADAQPETQGYVLSTDEGEQLMARAGEIFIKVDATRGSNNLDFGTLRVQAGSGILTHRHAGMDEIFYVLEGSGTFVLDDVRHPFEKGATVFIPRGTWHGLENPSSDMVVIWGITPAGFANFFRVLGNPPGTLPKSLTLEQRNEIARKFGTTYR
jgi:mannose-6-phosphate isomerase-like protein (cupin superfamily)